MFFFHFCSVENSFCWSCNIQLVLRHQQQLLVLLCARTEVTALVDALWKCQLLPLLFCFINNECHSFKLMYFNVAVKEPVSRIIGLKINHNVSSCWNHNRVFTYSTLVYCQLWRLIVFPAWLGATIRIASIWRWTLATTTWVVTLNVWIVNRIYSVICRVIITVWPYCLFYETSIGIIAWIAHFHDMEWVPVQVDGMGIVVCT